MSNLVAVAYCRESERTVFELSSILFSSTHGSVNYNLCIRIFTSHCKVHNHPRNWNGVGALLRWKAFDLAQSHTLHPSNRNVHTCESTFLVHRTPSHSPFYEWTVECCSPSPLNRLPFFSSYLIDSWLRKLVNTDCGVKVMVDYSISVLWDRIHLQIARGVWWWLHPLSHTHRKPSNEFTLS